MFFRFFNFFFLVSAFWSDEDSRIHSVLQLVNFVAQKLNAVGALIRDKEHIEGFGIFQCFAEGHYVFNLGDHCPARLLCCAFGNRLPSRYLIFFLFFIEPDDASCHFDGNDFRRTELNGFLNYQLHFIRFRKSLKKDESNRQLRIFELSLFNVGNNTVTRKFTDRTAVACAVAVIRNEFFTGLHSQNIFYMIDVAARDNNLLFRNIFRRYKKVVHNFSPRLFKINFPKFGICFVAVDFKNYVVGKPDDFCQHLCPFRQLGKLFLSEELCVFFA